MSPKLLLFSAILGTIVLAVVILGTFIKARRRYWKRYLKIFTDDKPPFILWWLKKYRFLLGSALGVYLVTGMVAGYFVFRTPRAVPANRATAALQQQTPDQKKLWKSYVELSVAAEKEPQNAPLQLKLARTLRDLRMGQKALSAYRKVIYLDANSREAQYELGCLAAVMDDLPLATSQATLLTSRWPDQPEAHLLRGLIATRSGNAAEAREQVRAALAIDPGHKEARSILTAAALQQRDFREAATLAEAGLKLDPADINLQMQLARSQTGLRQYAAAQATLRKAAEQNPASPEPLVILADLQVVRGEYLPAIATYEEVLKRDPNHQVAMNNIAQLTADHGYEYERAAQLASRLYATYPQDPLVADTLGWVLCKQGKLDQALPLLRTAAVGNPGHPAIRYHYGAALLKAGDNVAGRKELEAALKLSKDFDGADQARALLKKA